MALRVTFIIISPARVIGKAASHLQTRGPRRLSSTGMGCQGAYDLRCKGLDHTNEAARARSLGRTGQHNSPSGSRDRTPRLADRAAQELRSARSSRRSPRWAPRTPTRHTRQPSASVTSWAALAAEVGSVKERPSDRVMTPSTDRMASW